eukprot:TRINITY_DN37803_c0_g1_i1.p1 TRINITY_DN37803_c0_g1~~TRINITY_DN37803_c0_g1_i1.p1  ORF type:complete len:161 (+),score=26.80 TRINITY_DN37803_c0_g1_i1:515-997(+)
MRELGRKAGIELDYGVRTNWQPVNSQRVMMWARRYGQQEAYMSAMARRHFEEKKSASHRSTILEAVEEAGLDVAACEAFLDSDELVADVWKSYGDTIHKHHISAIPYFVFNSPLTDGGPFRNGRGKPAIEHGSGSQSSFLALFEQLFEEWALATDGAASL